MASAKAVIADYVKGPTAFPAVDALKAPIKAGSRVGMLSAAGPTGALQWGVFETAAKAMGVSERTIAFKHILPNVVSVILVTLTLDFAGCMLTESSLSYLGFGVHYPRPTWGNMLNGANNATIIGNYWWQWLFTSLFLAITTICINIVGDTLRDVMDPKSNIDK